MLCTLIIQRKIIIIIIVYISKIIYIYMEKTHAKITYNHKLAEKINNK